MSVDLGDDAIYLVKWLASISIFLSPNDVLEMNDVLFVLGLKKNIYLLFYIIDFQFRVAFEGQQCTIIDFNLASPRTLVRGMWDGGLYMLLTNPLALVYAIEKQGEPSSFEEGDA